MSSADITTTSMDATTATPNNAGLVSVYGSLRKFAEKVLAAQTKTDFDAAKKSLETAHETVSMLLLMKYYKDQQCAQEADYIVNREHWPDLRKGISEACREKLKSMPTGLLGSGTDHQSAPLAWGEKWIEHLDESKLDKKSLTTLLENVHDGLVTSKGSKAETAGGLMKDGLDWARAIVKKEKSFTQGSEA